MTILFVPITHCLTFAAPCPTALDYSPPSPHPPHSTQPERLIGLDSGELYLHPEAARRLAETLRPGPDEQQEPKPDILTEREIEALVLIAHGLSNQEIADELSITLKTVKAHASSILQKLGLNSRVQAALYALRHNIVKLDGI